MIPSAATIPATMIAGRITNAASAKIKPMAFLPVVERNHQRSSDSLQQPGKDNVKLPRYVLLRHYHGIKKLI